MPQSLLYLIQLFLYEALGLCPEGKGAELVDSAKWITNGKGCDSMSSFVMYEQYKPLTLYLYLMEED